MPEPKAQLVDPQGPIDVPGISATGIVTATGGFIGAVQGAATGFAATTYNISAGVVTSTGFVGDATGTASSVTKGTDLYVGVMTASSFSGDVFGNAAGLSTTTAGLKLGIVTSTTFAGDFTGMGSGITGTPNIQAGIMTATSFVGDFTGIASGITGAPNIMVGILTGTSYSGDGSNLTGIAATNWITNNVTANSSTTTVDLSDGNVVKFTQSADTTVSFANTGTSNIVTFLRYKDSTDTARTLTWPSGVKWNGGEAPTLISEGDSGDVNVINLLTRDEGATWYGWQSMSYDGPYHATTMWSWGYNREGRLGQNQDGGGPGQNNSISSPTQIGSATNWLPLAVTTNSSNSTSGFAAINLDGELWTWGWNHNGQLGHNDRTDRSSPTQIPGTTWDQACVAAYTGLGARKTDGTLWVWGGNGNGELGLNNTTKYSSPVQLPGTTWSRAFIHRQGSTAAVKTNGTYWSWGYNYWGTLGHNQAHSSKISSPTQLPGTNWSTNRRHNVYSAQCSASIKTDGTLWTWGRNRAGNLGLNSPDNDHRSSPVQVGSDTTWRSISASYRSFAATKTDGTLWVWGANDEGALGLNAEGGWPSFNNARSSPTQIPGTNWDSTSTTGNYAGLVTKTDGTLWVWGHNHRGQLGLNNTTSYSSPVQLPGTDWISIYGGGYFHVGFKTAL